MARGNRKLILQTLETLYELQLKGVRQLMDQDKAQKPARQKKGRRSRSLIDNTINILTYENRPLHVNQLVELLQERFNRSTDRDTLSSALSKKARQGLLVQQTGPATFGLLETEDE